MERRDTFTDQIWKSRHKNVVMYPGPHSNFMTRFEAKGWPLGSGSALGMERDDSDGDSSGYIPNSPTNQSRHRCYTHEEAETHCPKALAQSQVCPQGWPWPGDWCVLVHRAGERGLGEEWGWLRSTRRPVFLRSAGSFTANPQVHPSGGGPGGSPVSGDRLGP